MVRAMELATDMAGVGARILMVDDDPGIRDVVSDFLGRHGYKVELIERPEQSSGLQKKAATA